MNLIPEPNNPEDDDPAGRIVRHDDGPDPELVRLVRGVSDAVGQSIAAQQAVLERLEWLVALLERRA